MGRRVLTFGIGFIMALLALLCILLPVGMRDRQTPCGTVAAAP